MGVGFNPDRADATDGSMVHTVLSVGTSPVQVKVGAGILEERQIAWIYNDSTVDIYWGGASVSYTGSNKGVPLAREQFVSLPFGNTPIYVVAASTGPHSVIVVEVA